MDHEHWTATETLGGRYVLHAQVGSGRTTTVFAADDVRLERRVAVKLFHDLPDEDGFSRFAGEARVLAGLSHPGLVTVYDVNLDTDRPYMVMRLIDGGTLSDHVSVDPLAPAEVARLGAGLADVLAYVHERGVVHGDVEARNVLVDAQGTGHLTGFGLNQGLGRPSGDIYALGMMLSGCLPYDLGPEWDVVLGGMTDEDPAERPDAVRCGELLRNIESGSTSEFPLPRFGSSLASTGEPDSGSGLEPEPDEQPVTRTVLPAKKSAKKTAKKKSAEKTTTLPAKHKQRLRPVAYTGLAGMGLAVTALAVVLATVSTDPSGQTGDERQPQVEQPSEGTHIQPPGQSYPTGAPERGEVRDREPEPPSRKANQATPAPPSGTENPKPPPPGGPADDDGAGNENGPGNGGPGNGQQNGRHKSLLEVLLGL